MKPFKTIDEQLEILKSRNLDIDNEPLARKNLQRYGYYEIVNGYKSFLLETEESNEHFKDGETFTHLFSLFELDKTIRYGVMQATLEVELSLRTAIAYTLGEDFGELQTDYLKPQNFRRGKKRKNSNRYPLYQLLDKLDNIANDDIEPYKHYRDNHGNIPPWILLKGTTFGNLVNLYKLLKPVQKSKVIELCLGLDSRFVTEQVKEMFSQSLDVILKYRNRVAHSGRIFSYKSEKTMSYNELFHGMMQISREDFDNGKGHTGLNVLEQILEMFDNSKANLLFKFNFYFYIKKHFENYPEDAELLCLQTGYKLEELLKKSEFLDN